MKMARRRSNDDRPCALLFRKKPRAEWEHHCYTLSVSVAWRSADMLLHGLVHDDGLKNAQVTVMLRELYDEGRGKPMTPPEGFEHLSLSKRGAGRVRREEPPPEPKAEPLPAVVVVDDSEEEGLGAIDKDTDF